MTRRQERGEQVAAILSLLSLSAALVLVVVGVLSNWQGVVVMLAGLLAMVVGAWYAVSRRGTARSVAVLVVVLGTMVLVAGFVVAEASPARMIAIVLLGALSIGSARYVFHRSRRALRGEALKRTPAPAARHGVLLINPKSGGGKAEKFNLVGACRERGIDAIVLQPGDDLLELAEQAVAAGADVLGMAGGDGSQALVASVAVRHDLPHVVIPSGTRNHFALDLGLDRNDVIGALDAYDDGFESRIDLATINGRVFVNNATAGLYATVVQSPEYRDDKRGTAAEVLPDLLGPDATPLDLRFTGPDGAAYETAQVILVSNNAYDHALTSRWTRGRLDDGVLGIVVARFANAADFARFMALEAVGQPQRYHDLLEWSAPQFRVDSDAPIPVGVDGEALTFDPPLLFEIRPQALRVRMPRTAIGRSPAAIAIHLLSQSTLAQLVRIAKGAPPDAGSL